MGRKRGAHDSSDDEHQVKRMYTGDAHKDRDFTVDVMVREQKKLNQAASYAREMTKQDSLDIGRVEFWCYNEPGRTKDQQDLNIIALLTGKDANGRKVERIEDDPAFRQRGLHNQANKCAIGRMSKRFAPNTRSDDALIEYERAIEAEYSVWNREREALNLEAPDPDAEGMVIKVYKKLHWQHIKKLRSLYNKEPRYDWDAFVNKLEEGELNVDKGVRSVNIEDRLKEGKFRPMVGQQSNIRGMITSESPREFFKVVLKALQSLSSLVPTDQKLGATRPHAMLTDAAHLTFIRTWVCVTRCPEAVRTEHKDLELDEYKKLLLDAEDNRVVRIATRKEQDPWSRRINWPQGPRVETSPFYCVERELTRVHSMRLGIGIYRLEQQDSVGSQLRCNPIG